MAQTSPMRWRDYVCKELEVELQRTADGRHAAATEQVPAEPPQAAPAIDVRLPDESPYSFEQLLPENAAKYVGRGRPLERQAQAIVLSVLSTFEKERLNGGPLVAPSAVQLRTANACSIGRSSIKRLMRCAREGGELETPGKSRPRATEFPKIDGFTIENMRKIAHRFFAQNKHLTLAVLLEKCKEELDFPYSRQTLYVLMTHNGFKFKKRGNRLVLTERAEIRAWRIRFLREMRQLQQRGAKIFCLDETWVNVGYVTPRAWYDEKVERQPELALQPNSGLTLGYKDPTGKGERLIVTHIGSTDGFLDGGLLTFQSKSTGDYHEDMNSERFERYFSEQVLPNVPHGSAVLMDNASYHSRLLNPPPNSNTRRGDMEQWLRENGVEFDASVRRKGDLYKRFILPIRNEPQFKTYAVDEMAARAGVQVIRQPPYHCQFNPIELIWALLKTRVAKRNETRTLASLKEIFAEEVARISADDWQRACGHVQRILAEYFEKHEIAPLVAPVVIDAADQSDNEDSADNIDSESDDENDSILVDAEPEDLLPPNLTLQDIVSLSHHL